jgi:hypothetical protein
LLLPLLYKPTELRWRLKCLQCKLVTLVFAELLFCDTLRAPLLQRSDLTNVRSIEQTAQATGGRQVLVSGPI